MYTKRNVITLAGSAATAGLLWREGSAIAATQAQALRDAARAAGLHVGTVDDTSLARAPEYADLVFRQCDLLAPNMPWYRISPQPGAYDFSVCQADVDLAVAHGLRLTGYHLVWHQGMPAWFTAIEDPHKTEQAVSDYISALALRFAKSTYSWNVVNEVINPQEGRPDGLRHTPLLKQKGPDYIDFAFRVASRVAPDVLRVYNDYNIELAEQSQEARRTALLRLLDTLQRANCPIDAVGLQAHLTAEQFGLFDSKVYRKFLREIASRHLKILITELDAFDTSTAAIPIRDKTIADIYRSFLSVTLDEPAVVAVVVWGLSDKYTWLNPSYSPKFARPDGSPARPLPFDSSLAQKPAFDAILAAFKAAPKR